MKPEEEKVKESFKNFLKNNLDAVHVIYHSKKLPIKVFKLFFKKFLKLSFTFSSSGFITIFEPTNSPLQ